MIADTLVALCVFGVVLGLARSALMLHDQLEASREENRKLAALINKNAGRLHDVEGKVGRLQGAVDLLAEDVAIVDYRRELLGDDRRTYVSPN